MFVVLQSVIYYDYNYNVGTYCNPIAIIVPKNAINSYRLLKIMADEQKTVKL